MARTNDTAPANILERYFPWLAVGFTMFVLVLSSIPPAARANQYDFYEFGKIPVLDGGRIKPIDTFARVSMQKIAGRTSYTDQWRGDWPERAAAGQTARSHSAMEWLLDLMVTRLKEQGLSTSGMDPVFRIDHFTIIDTLKLNRREGLRYGFDEIAGKEPASDPEMAQKGMTANLEWIETQADRASKLKPEQQDKLDQRVTDLAQRINLYRAIEALANPRTVPPTDPKVSQEWLPLIAMLQRGQVTDDAKAFSKILLAYSERKPDDFNDAVVDYKKRIAGRFAPELNKSAYETAFNHLDPFFVCKVLYLTIGIIGVFSWLGWFEPLRKTAFNIGIVTLGVHTFAILVRMYLQGRPPVTNLYSSAVFIGYGCTILALALEAIFRRGIGNVIAAVLGFSTMQIAQFLADNTGDTLEMMQAVLDTNFWLATHVTCVSLGYTASLVAGVIGAMYLLTGIFSPVMTAKLEKSFSQMLYGTLCFATLLSFTGTVLGGIWADYSWGRFWGWDPKENGAVLVVLWNVLILHARWSGQVKMRGIAVLSQLGNMVVVWSWFGTNQLGIGLHAYGFSAKLAYYCAASWLAFGAIAAIGMLPKGWWWSSWTTRVPSPAPMPSTSPAQVAADAATIALATQTRQEQAGKPSIRRLRKN